MVQRPQLLILRKSPHPHLINYLDSRISIVTFRYQASIPFIPSWCITGVLPAPIVQSSPYYSPLTSLLSIFSTNYPLRSIEEKVWCFASISLIDGTMDRRKLKSILEDYRLMLVVPCLEDGVRNT